MEHKKLLEDFDRKRKQAKQKQQSKLSKDGDGKSKHGKKKQKVDDSESLQLSAVYRDRAKERREGLNKDFEDPDDGVLFNPLANPEAPDVADELIDTEERRRQEIEESKYLGGDVEHTHLVKGLDFALLDKVKRDQKLSEDLSDNRDRSYDLNVGAHGSDSEEEEFMNEAILAATSGAKRSLLDIDKLKKGNSTEIIPCRTAIARRILNVLGEKWPNKCELFAPGRMSYVVSVDIGDDEPKEQQTVTTILRSKGDATTQDDTSGETDSDLALDQLINILTRVGKGGTSKPSTSSGRRIKAWDEDDPNQDYQY